MSEAVHGLAAVKSRREKLKSAVSDLDGRIATLERQQGGKADVDRLSGARELRSLRDQRSLAADLLTEAEIQLDAKRAEYTQTVEAVSKNLGRIGGKCSDAARRFDQALSDALGALDELEREAAPLVNILLPDGLRMYTSPRCVNAAFAKAFESRLGRSVATAEKQSMVQRIELMLISARENAAQKRREAA